jgi:hypothetical protein
MLGCPASTGLLANSVLAIEDQGNRTPIICVSIMLKNLDWKTVTVLCKDPWGLGMFAHLLKSLVD